MSKASKVVFYGSAALALMFYVKAFLCADVAIATYCVANACFCAIWSIWAKVKAE